MDGAATDYIQVDLRSRFSYVFKSLDYSDNIYTPVIDSSLHLAFRLYNTSRLRYHNIEVVK